jgi:hypothetical protein
MEIFSKDPICAQFPELGSRTADLATLWNPREVENGQIEEKDKK